MNKGPQPLLIIILRANGGVRAEPRSDTMVEVKTMFNFQTWGVTAVNVKEFFFFYLFLISVPSPLE